MLSASVGGRCLFETHLIISFLIGDWLTLIIDFKNSLSVKETLFLSRQGVKSLATLSQTAKLKSSFSLTLQVRYELHSGCFVLSAHVVQL